MPLRIKEVIKERGTTVQDLAERMGITRVGLSQHINGNPSVEVLERIASAIGCSVTELFEQPNKDVLSLTCPHCGKSITLKVE
ncbi:helix-turn-helix domain-containing protein [Paraprevotella clara]|uniref:helix-turn-helix domain-containing protein n=1 Tax=Paraprevotella clara TaxID=454154 RepID=UPI002675B8A4|nr:helix-turn-helix transcriptional regulator [Paraprevotella clara]